MPLLDETWGYSLWGFGVGQSVGRNRLRVGRRSGLRGSCLPTTHQCRLGGAQAGVGKVPWGVRFLGTYKPVFPGSSGPFTRASGAAALRVSRWTSLSARSLSTRVAAVDVGCGKVCSTIVLLAG
jgi:hypothetical protein